jgi:hypothetical protein
MSAERPRLLICPRQNRRNTATTGRIRPERVPPLADEGSLLCRALRVRSKQETANGSLQCTIN